MSNFFKVTQGIVMEPILGLLSYANYLSPLCLALGWLQEAAAGLPTTHHTSVAVTGGHETNKTGFSDGCGSLAAWDSLGCRAQQLFFATTASEAGLLVGAGAARGQGTSTSCQTLFCYNSSPKSLARSVPGNSGEAGFLGFS